jgi:hypothetical protein
MRAVSRLRIGLALRALPGFVVVTELNEIVLPPFRERLRPPSFIDKALGTAAVRRYIDDFHLSAHELPEAGAPARVVGHRRIADEDHTDRRRRLRTDVEAPR